MQTVYKNCFRLYTNLDFLLANKATNAFVINTENLFLKLFQDMRAITYIVQASNALSDIVNFDQYYQIQLQINTITMTKLFIRINVNY